MTPARTYRTLVIPLSALLIFGGAVVAACAWAGRIRITAPFPFVTDEMANRHMLGALGLTCLAIGIGLFRRSRFAWYALLAYLGIGTALPVLSLIDEQVIDTMGYAFPVFGSILNGAIGVTIYYAMRSAFVQVTNPTRP